MSNEQIDELRQLEAELNLGHKAKQFFESDIGRYLLGVASQELALERRKFENCDPNHAETMKGIHYNIRCIKGTINWLNELIQRGSDAAYQLEEAAQGE